MKYLEVRIESAAFGDLEVLKSIEFSIRRGEILCIVGPNGSGKSTVLKTIAGLVENSVYVVSLAGRSVGSSPQHALAGGIALLPQDSSIFQDLTVQENLTVGGHLLSGSALCRRMAIVLEVFPELRSLLRQRAGSLSGGEARSLGIARSLMPEPSVLLLDEPSIGLDPMRLAALFDRLAGLRRDHQTSIILAEQRLSEALKLSDSVLALQRGHLVFQGTPKRFKAVRMDDRLWHDGL